MAQGKEAPIAANVLGTIGTVLWCVQLVPQIWYNWRRKDTSGLPSLMIFSWGLCSSPFGIYMILQDANIPLQIQPQIFGFLCLLCWAQILVYTHKHTPLKATLLALVIGSLLAGSELLFVFTLRIPYGKGVTWPVSFFGVVATILLLVGLLPTYKEIHKRRGRVIGISWVFLSMDILGALFSLLALFFEGCLDDIPGLMLYIPMMVLELGIIVSHVTWRLTHRKLLEEAKAAGLTVDEFLEGRETHTHENKAMAEAPKNLEGKNQPV